MHARSYTHLEWNTSWWHQLGSPPPQIASTSLSCCASFDASLLLTNSSRGADTYAGRPAGEHLYVYSSDRCQTKLVQCHFVRLMKS